MNPSNKRHRILLMLLTSCAVVLTASAADPVPNTFVDGTVIVADEVNANFQALVDTITALEGQLAAVSGQVTTLGTDLTAAQTNIATLQSDNTTLTGKITTLESTLAAVSDDGTDFVITARNVHIRSGSGATDDDLGDGACNPCTGLGNLIVGYNEDAESDDVRTGSHNLVIGDEHTFTSIGGLVASFNNNITGPSASVIGGSNNTASGDWSSVSGGQNNTASGTRSSVIGGQANIAAASQTTITGGNLNIASAFQSSVNGGTSNNTQG